MVNTVTVDMDGTFILFGILITLIVITLRIAYMNNNKWRSLMTLSGVLVMIMSIVLFDLASSITMSWSSILIITYKAVSTLIGIVGLLLFFFGVIQLFKSDEKRG
jgi:hypothetical protein